MSKQNKRQPFDFEKWIAAAVNDADARKYGVTVAESEDHKRFSIIDHAVELIDRSHGEGYAVKHPRHVVHFVLECISKIGQRLRVIERQKGLK